MVLLEGGARFQPMQDKIYLCNDDREEGMIEFSKLGEYKTKTTNEYRRRVLSDRDFKV